MQGFSPSDVVLQSGSFSHSTMLSLAGNAFSGFAVVGVLMSLFANADWAACAKMYKHIQKESAINASASSANVRQAATQSSDGGEDGCASEGDEEENKVTASSDLESLSQGEDIG